MTPLTYAEQSAYITKLEAQLQANLDALSEAMRELRLSAARASLRGDKWEAERYGRFVKAMRERV